MFEHALEKRQCCVTSIAGHEMHEWRTMFMLLWHYFHYYSHSGHFHARWTCHPWVCLLFFSKTLHKTNSWHAPTVRSRCQCGQGRPCLLRREAGLWIHSYVFYFFLIYNWDDWGPQRFDYSQGWLHNSQAGGLNLPLLGVSKTPFWVGSSNTNQQVILDLLVLANSHDIPWCSHLSGWPIATNNSVTVGKHPWQFIGLCPHNVPLMALTSFLPSSPKHG